MFLIILLLQIVNAQEIEFDIRDNSLYEYNNISKKNEAIKLDLDSVRFYNAKLGINTILKYSKNIGINKILNTSKYDLIPLEINLNENSFSAKSYEIIKNITVYDLLGNEVINKNLNSKEVTLNHNFNNFLYFVQIRTDKNLYNSKVIKAQNTNFYSKSIIMSEDKWQITLYKFAFKPKTLEFPLLPTKIEDKLQRIKIKIEYDFDVNSMIESETKRVYNYYSSDTINMNLDKSTILFDKVSYSGFWVGNTVIDEFSKEREYNSFVAYSNDEGYYYYIDSLYNFNEIIVGYSKVIDYNVYGKLFKLTINDPIDLKPLFKGEISDIEYVLEDRNSEWDYEYSYEFVWSITSFESNYIRKFDISKISGTIKISIVD